MKTIKRRLPFYLRVTLCVLSAGTAALSACSQSAGRTEENLSRYTRALDLYARGQFPETAGLLAGISDFPPALVLRATS
jgi:hypothetical protein